MILLALQVLDLIIVGFRESILRKEHYNLAPAMHTLDWH